jgi:hypothetical protein
MIGGKTTKVFEQFCASEPRTETIRVNENKILLLILEPIG